jgi:hypothetical protein
MSPAIAAAVRTEPAVDQTVHQPSTATRRSSIVHRRRPFLVLAAVLAVAALVAACGGSGSATAVPDGPAASGGQPLPAGTYSSLAFQPTATYTVPDGWERAADTAGFHQLRPFGSDVASVVLFSRPAAAVQDAACTAVADATVGTTSTDLVKWIGERPGLTVSTPAMVTVGGLTGQMVDIGIKDGWNQSCPFASGLPTVPLFNGGTAGYHWVVYGDERMRLYLLDLPGGGTVGVGIDSLDPSVVDQLISQATPIVKSLQFKTGA